MRTSCAAGKPRVDCVVVKSRDAQNNGLSACRTILIASHRGFLYTGLRARGNVKHNVETECYAHAYLPKIPD